jgi:hypothetical protein
MWWYAYSSGAKPPVQPAHTSPLVAMAGHNFLVNNTPEAVQVEDMAAVQLFVESLLPTQLVTPARG